MARHRRPVGAPFMELRGVRAGAVALALLAAASTGCRTARSVPGDRDLLAPPARQETGAPGPRPVVAQWCGAGAGALRAELARHPHDAAPSEIAVRGGAKLVGTGIGTAGAVAIYTWDIIMGIPGTILPIPVFFSGEWVAHLEFLDRQTGIAIDSLREGFVYRGWRPWVWGLIGANVCMPHEFAPIVRPMVEERIRRLSQPAERRRWLRASLEQLEDAQRRLRTLAEGKNPSGRFAWPPATGGPARPPGSCDAPVLAARETRSFHRVDQADGGGRVRRGGWFGREIWAMPYQREGLDGTASYRTCGEGAEELYRFEYAFEYQAEKMTDVPAPEELPLVRAVPALAALRRAVEENEAHLRSVRERLRSLGE